MSQVVGGTKNDKKGHGINVGICLEDTSCVYKNYPFFFFRRKSAIFFS